MRHRFSGARAGWTIRLSGYELRTLDVGYYLQSYEWRWEQNPDYQDPPPEIFICSICDVSFVLVRPRPNLL